MDGYEILKQIGYDNESITSTEKWIAEEVYKLNQSPERVSVDAVVIEPNHPEAICKKCGGKNTLWYAKNDVWNKIMRDADRLEDDWGIICPLCFLELAQSKGENLIFTTEDL